MSSTNRLNQRLILLHNDKKILNFPSEKSKISKYLLKLLKLLKRLKGLKGLKELKEPSSFVSENMAGR